MTFTDDELLALAGLLLHLLHLDSLDEDVRRAAIEDVALEVDARAAELERQSTERASYRDAGRAFRQVVVDLHPWMERARRELTSPTRLRQRVERVTSSEVRIAILRGLHVLAERGGLSAREEIFLAWLALLWREAPRRPDADATTDATFATLPKSDRVVLAGLVQSLLDVSSGDAAAKERALDAGLRSLSATREELSPWADAARRDIQGDAHLRALASFGVTSTRSREAIVRALLTIAYDDGIEPGEESLLHWLARTWSMI